MSTGGLSIREASAQDAAELAELLRQLGYPAEQAFVSDKLDELSKTASARVLVAEKGGVVVGFLAFDSQILFHQAGRIGCIMAMCVEEGQRGEGIGRMLVSEAERVAIAEGCIKISVASGVRRLATHEFYKGLGYEEITRRFVKQLVG